MIWTASDLSALQLESSITWAVTEDPGAIRTVVAALPECTAGLPTSAPSRINCTPGKPVSEQAWVEVLVNCRNAYWCPAAPDARSALIDSAAVTQLPAPSTGPATGLAEVGDGDGMGSVAGAEARADELGFGFGFGALVGGAVVAALLDTDTVAEGAFDDGVGETDAGTETDACVEVEVEVDVEAEVEADVEAEAEAEAEVDTDTGFTLLGWIELAVLCDAVVQPTVNSRPALSTPASRRLSNTALISLRLRFA